MCSRPSRARIGGRGQVELRLVLVVAREQRPPSVSFKKENVRYAFARTRAAGRSDIGPTGAVVLRPVKATTALRPAHVGSYDFMSGTTPPQPSGGSSNNKATTSKLRVILILTTTTPPLRKIR